MIWGWQYINILGSPTLGDTCGMSISQPAPQHKHQSSSQESLEVIFLRQSRIRAPKFCTVSCNSARHVTWPWVVPKKTVRLQGWLYWCRLGSLNLPRIGILVPKMTGQYIIESYRSHVVVDISSDISREQQYDIIWYHVFIWYHKMAAVWLGWI